jgi:hypothetical protein
MKKPELKVAKNVRLYNMVTIDKGKVYNVSKKRKNIVGVFMPKYKIIVRQLDGKLFAVEVPQGIQTHGPSVVNATIVDKRKFWTTKTRATK